MNILQIMPQFPFPSVDGGKVGLANIAHQFAAQGHTVDLVCYRAEQHSPYDDELLQQGIRVHAIPYEPTNTPLRIALSLFGRRALYMSKHETILLNEVIGQIISSQRIDVIHADHTCMAPIAQRFAVKNGMPWGFRLHNIEWWIWQRYAERFAKWHPAHWYLTGQAKKIKQEEDDLLKKANIVFAISEHDRKIVAQNGANAVVSTAGVDPEMWMRDRTGSEQLRVVMASTYRWRHNSDALKWFIDNVWKSINSVLPGAEFHVVGTDPPDWLAQHQSIGVRTVGFVTDLADYYSTCRVSVAPLFVGSGMRIKILEALAAGLPVVTTSVGAEGIDIDQRCGLVRADSAEEMTRSLLRLLHDDALRTSLGKLGQEQVSTSYTWKSSVGIMLRHYQQLLSQR